MPDIEIPQELLRKISEGRCVAYIGAGLSIGAGLPDWYTLISKMIEWCEKNSIVIPKKDDLNKLLTNNDFLTLGNVLVESMSKEQFQQFMVGMFKDPALNPTEVHLLLAQLPFAAVLTSNYDDLIAVAYIEAKGQPVSIFTHLDIASLAKTLQSDDFYILHTHGHIDQPDSIVLSRNQYRDLMIANLPYSKHMENVLTSKTILFLGFSLTDPDLMSFLDQLRTIFKTSSVTHYALMNSDQLTDLEIDRFYKDYGIQIISYTPSAPNHPEVCEFLETLVIKTPKRFLKHIEKARQELEDLDENFRLVSNTEGEFIVKEKYPGSGKDGLKGHGFTLVGEEAMAMWKKVEDTGEKTTFTDEFVKDVKFPDIITKAFGEMKITQMTVGTYQSGKKTRIKLTFTSNDGKTETIDNIELETISSGAKQSVLNNEAQNYFITVKLTCFWDRDKIEVSLAPKYSEVFVNQALQLYRFFLAIEKGGELVIELSETGAFVGKTVISPSAAFYTPPNYWGQTIESLGILQRKSKLTFKTPEDFTDEDIKIINETAQLVQNGKGDGKIEVKAELPRDVIENLLLDKAKLAYYYSADYRPVILGQEISVGNIWIDASEMIFSDDEKTRLEGLLESNSEQHFFLCNLISNSLEPTLIYYIDHLSEESFEQLFEYQKYREYSFKELMETVFDSVKTEGNLDVDRLIEFVKIAKEQKNDFGKPFNMLGRFTFEELQNVLEPHLLKMSSSDADKFLTGLKSLGLLDDNELAVLATQTARV